MFVGIESEQAPWGRGQQAPWGRGQHDHRLTRMVCSNNPIGHRQEEEKEEKGPAKESIAKYCMDALRQ